MYSVVNGFLKLCYHGQYLGFAKVKLEGFNCKISIQKCKRMLEILRTIRVIQLQRSLTLCWFCAVCTVLERITLTLVPLSLLYMFGLAESDLFKATQRGANLIKEVFTALHRLRANFPGRTCLQPYKKNKLWLLPVSKVTLCTKKVGF